DSRSHSKGRALARGCHGDDLSCRTGHLSWWTRSWCGHGRRARNVGRRGRLSPDGDRAAPTIQMFHAVRTLHDEVQAPFTAIVLGDVLDCVLRVHHDEGG